jgi:hypothetical protein
MTRHATIQTRLEQGARPSPSGPARCNPYRLAGATLVEVLVSLSLASIVFVIALMVWLQISGPRATYRDIEHRMEARKLIAQAITDHDPHDRIVTIGATKYVRRVRLVHHATQLYEITVAVYLEGKKPLFQRGKIARIHAP